MDRAALSEVRTRAKLEVREPMSGNVRRCTGDHHVVDAVEEAAGVLHPK